MIARSTVKKTLVGEKHRRAALTRALAAVLIQDDHAETLTAVRLRRHLSIHFGADVGLRASFAELAAGVAKAGGEVKQVELHHAAGTRNRVFLGVALVTPSARASVAQWERILAGEGMPPELPMIRRNPSGKDHEDHCTSFAAPSGVYNAGGIWRQAPDSPEATGVTAAGPYTDGSTSRVRRMPAYLEAMTAYLREMDERGGWRAHPGVERTIVELLTEGRTVREIGIEVGKTKSAIHRIVARHCRLAGVNGPGPGR